MAAIEGIVQGAEDVARFAPGVLKEGKAIISGGEKAASEAGKAGEAAEKGASEAGDIGKTAEQDAKGAENAGKEIERFRGAKTLAKAGIAGGIGDEIVKGVESALGAGSQSTGGQGSGDTDGNGGIPTATGGNSSDSNNEPSSTSSGTQPAQEPDDATSTTESSNEISGDNGILAILREILNVQTESLAELQLGFRSLFEAFEQNTNSVQQQMQGNLIQEESRSSGADSSTVPERSRGMMGRIGAGVKGVATTLGLTALAGGVMSLLTEAGVFGGKDKKEDSTPARSGTQQSTSTPSAPTQESKQQEAIDQLKEKYGKDKYAEVVAAKVISDYLLKNKDNPEVQAETPKELAADQFGLIMKFYDMLDQNGKNQIIALLANINHLKKNEVEHIIHVQSSPGMKAVHGVEAGLDQGLLATIGGVGKLAHFAIGAGAAAIGGVENTFGANGDSLMGFAHYEFNGANKGINEWERKRYEAGTSGSALGQSDSAWAKGTNIAFQAGASLLGTGGMGLLAKGAIAGAGALGAVTDNPFSEDATKSFLRGGVGEESSTGSIALSDNDPAPKDPQGRQRYAVEYLKTQGWTQAQAEGIVANLIAESQLSTTAVGDHGEAYGIAQWHPDRQKKFAEVIGKNIRGSSLGDQLKFVSWELRNSHSSAGKALSGAKDARSAAVIVDQKYEVSAERFGNDAIKRGNIAMSLAHEYGGAQTSPQVNSESIAPNTGGGNNGSSVVVADNSSGAVTVNSTNSITYPSAASPVKLKASIG